MSISRQNLSIVIVTFKSEMVIHNCIRSIEKDIKIIVVENSNNYQFKEELESTYANVSCVLTSKNLGMGSGNNIGIIKAKTDFVARRKPCKDFKKFEAKFKDIHTDLANGKRRLIDFRKDDLTEGDFYVHNGVLLLLENINTDRKEQTFASGRRSRKDGRTRCVFENGTESNMLYRSLGKIIYANGKVVTQHIDKYDEELVEKFIYVLPEDEEAGYIYVLKSKSEDHQIKSINNLFKIGFTRNDVEERIKNAEKDPTFLMAPVNTKGVWKCYNMNPQKFESLLHTFFGNSCLEIEIFDEKGEKHNPKEWFIAPIEVIEQAIELIINGKIVNYFFDPNNLTIVKKSSLP